MKTAWWKEAVVYQVYTRSFKDSNGDGIGDLGGVLEKLDYIADLGVGIIWLNPIYRSPNDDNGYDISDYRQIMDEFGTMSLFDELLAAVHSRGMRLIMDLVVNHTSDEHEWFRESRSSKESAYRDYYFWHPGKDGGVPNNWRSFFEGPTWELDPATGEYYLHLFSRRQPDLNWENERVRNEVRDIIRFWLEKGVDGFRMDVINLLSKVPGLPDGTDFSSLTGHEHFANGPRISEYMGFVRDSMKGYDVMTVGETTLADLETIAGYVDPEHGTVDMAINFEQVSIDRGHGVFRSDPARSARIQGEFRLVAAQARRARLELPLPEQSRSAAAGFALRRGRAEQEPVGEDARDAAPHAAGNPVHHAGRRDRHDERRVRRYRRVSRRGHAELLPRANRRR
jgi:oligo-1,6-glucosidase